MEYIENDITYWSDGIVTYQLLAYGFPPLPSACEWMVPGMISQQEADGERMLDGSVCR